MRHPVGHDEGGHSPQHGVQRRPGAGGSEQADQLEGRGSESQDRQQKPEGKPGREPFVQEQHPKQDRDQAQTAENSGTKHDEGENWSQEVRMPVRGPRQTAAVIGAAAELDELLYPVPGPAAREAAGRPPNLRSRAA